MSNFLGKKAFFDNLTISADTVDGYSMDQGVLTTSSPTFVGATLSGATASTLIYSNASKAITSLANGSGYLLNDGSGGLSWGAISFAGYLKADGTVPLTADWNVGAFDLTAVDLNSTGKILAADGTAAAPSICGTNDPNTGIYWPTGDFLYFSAGGAVRFGISTIDLYSNVLLNFDNGVFLFHDGATVLQQGKDAATPLDQSYKGPDTTTDNTNGGKVSIGPGTGKGTGYGQVAIRTSPVGSAGSTTNDLVDTVVVSGEANRPVYHYGANGATTREEIIVSELTTTAAATCTWTNGIPAGALVEAVCTRVTSVVTGDAGFTGISIGDGTDADRWGANVSPLANATTNLANATITTAPIYAAATSIVLTQVGGSTFVAGGKVRVAIHVKYFSAPTT